jgi:hypothetical protein
MSGYFRGVFAEKPQWLGHTSNDEILARYRTDHGLAADADVGQSVKQTLANIKSVLRKEHRQGGKGRALVAARGKSSLDTLEEKIDDVLSVARTMDPEGLAHVIKLLRHARNTVVWQAGQKA